MGDAQRSSPRGPIEWAGLAAGMLLAPLAGAAAALRRARTFHPDGVLYRATVEPLVEGGAAGDLGRRLAGEALVRFSNALWKGGRERLDILGCSIRFRSERIPSVIPAAGDQDLLLATVRSPWTLPFAPFSTHVHDFLRNDYYAVSPFEAVGLGRVKLRVAPVPVRLSASDRYARLQEAAEAGLAAMRLEYLPTGRRRWRALCSIRLHERLDLDQEALRFDPFRAGRGLRPVGFVHHLRPAAYVASQHFRPASAAERSRGAVRKPRWAPRPVEGSGRPVAPAGAVRRLPPHLFPVEPLPPQRW